MLEREWMGERWLFSPERALFHPRSGALFIADPHFGKDATLRASGIPVPPGSTAQDLARLEALLSATSAGVLVVLGDFFHTASSRSVSTLSLLEAWFGHHCALEKHLVLGNHDRHAGAPPAEWGFEAHEEPWTFQGLSCRHHPEDAPSTPTLAGHIHPSYRIVARGIPPLRRPCFHMRGRQIILPSFGMLTGLADVTAKSGDAFVLVGDGEGAELRIP